MEHASIMIVMRMGYDDGGRTEWGGVVVSSPELLGTGEEIAVVWSCGIVTVFLLRHVLERTRIDNGQTLREDRVIGGMVDVFEDEGLSTTSIANVDIGLYPGNGNNRNSSHVHDYCPVLSEEAN
jgi:hypothetical protein